MDSSIKLVIILSGNNFYELIFSYNINETETINKKILIKGNDYSMNHSFKLNNFDFNYSDKIELAWIGGLLPTERVPSEDVQNASFLVNFTSFRVKRLAPRRESWKIPTID